MRVANGHTLNDLVFRQPIHAALPSEAALLDTTKRQAGLRNLSSINTDHTTLERGRNPEYPSDILAEEVAGQAKLGSIGKLDSLGLRLKFKDGCEGSKGLIVGDQHVRCDTRENGRLVEEALVVGNLAAGLNFGTLRNSVLDVLSNLVDTALVDEWANSGLGVHSKTEFELVNAGNKLFGECGGDGFVDEQTVGAVRQCYLRSTGENL